MFGIIKNVASGIFLKNAYKFSAGYFSHRTTADNNDSTPFDFTEENYKEVYKILDKYPPNWKRSGIIPLLHLAQKQNNNFLSLNAMKTVAKIC
jgi:NADH dehydrogenase (ubiquinone) flavoprotein 2